jgi:hypothetical protein
MTRLRNSFDAVAAPECTELGKQGDRRFYTLTAWRGTDPPFVISPLIAVQFVMPENLGPDAFRARWDDFMAGYRQRFRSGGLRAANGFALQQLCRLGQPSTASGRRGKQHNSSKRAEHCDE